MYTYKTFTTITDMGPYVTKLIIQLPDGIGISQLHPETLEVYVERKSKVTGDLIYTKNFLKPDEEPYPSQGYQKVTKIYPCDSDGLWCDNGNHAALELESSMLGKRTEGTMLSSAYVINDYKITLSNLSSQNHPSSVIFDTCLGDICPQLKGWANSEHTTGELKLNYGYFTPENLSDKYPLVIWLHGAGEGGTDPKIAYTGNKVVHLSSPEIQKKLGGKAWILVPQCPTVWMDDGIEQLGHSNISIYTKPLKECIDEFIRQHCGYIDTDKIFIGGCSNGGFMTVRMIIDYPGFFAAAFPACEAFYEENITDTMISQLKALPIWFIHDKDDELVNPAQTSLPLYHKLINAGAENIHFTYYDRSNNIFKEYGNKFKFPPETFKHAVWVNVYNDDCFTDIDGHLAMDNGKPVTLWTWLGNIAVSKQS